MLNKELINATMNLIKARPETHNQNTWVSEDAHSTCGTTMCFAGHAAVLAGAEIPDPKKHTISDWYVGPNGEYINGNEYYKNREGVAVATYAREAMGIQYHEASYMFEADRPVEDIELAVKELLEHGGIRTFNESEDDYDDDYCSCCSYDDCE